MRSEKGQIKFGEEAGRKLETWWILGSQAALLAIHLMHKRWANGASSSTSSSSWHSFAPPVSLIYQGEGVRMNFRIISDID